MTKLDGTARGGILVAIAAKYGLPVHFIGVGEGVDDLAPFAAKDFAKAIAGIDVKVGVGDWASTTKNGSNSRAVINVAAMLRKRLGL
jgi:signal recognition particle GTPase